MFGASKARISCVTVLEAWSAIRLIANDTFRFVIVARAAPTQISHTFESREFPRCCLTGTTREQPVGRIKCLADSKQVLVHVDRIFGRAEKETYFSCELPRAAPVVKNMVFHLRSCVVSSSLPATTHGRTSAL